MGKGIGEVRDHADDLSTKTSTLLQVSMSRHRASRVSFRAASNFVITQSADVLTTRGQGVALRPR